MNKKIILVLIVIVAIIAAIFLMSNNGTEVTINDIKFNVPDAFKDTVTKHEKTADQEVYNYESKDGDTISIGVINTNQNSISDLFPDYKSKGMTSDTIDGKEGYVAWDYQPAMGFYYVKNDKLVVLAVPYYCEETNQDYKELMEEIII